MIFVIEINDNTYHNILNIKINGLLTKLNTYDYKEPHFNKFDIMLLKLILEAWCQIYKNEITEYVY